LGRLRKFLCTLMTIKINTIYIEAIGDLCKYHKTSISTPENKCTGLIKIVSLMILTSVENFINFLRYHKPHSCVLQKTRAPEVE